MTSLVFSDLRLVVEILPTFQTLVGLLICMTDLTLRFGVGSFPTS